MRHINERPAELCNVTIFDRQRKKEKASIRIVSNQSWQRIVDTCLPHDGSSPLADGTTPDSTEPNVGKFQLSGGTVPRKSQDLRTPCYPLGIVLVLTTEAAGEDLSNIVSFSSMRVPHSVTWRDLTKILTLSILLDLHTVNW